ncbi:MAG: hypothetical protein LRY55_12205, partial [Leadbetterella sp.]|nr:hypothetical protein [Leadbetterella sp.]
MAQIRPESFSRESLKTGNSFFQAITIHAPFSTSPVSLFFLKVFGGHKNTLYFCTHITGMADGVM